MCGISGIIGHEFAEDTLREMLKVQHHRGPDAHAMLINREYGFGFAHNRLSIIDLSDDGIQPMRSVDDRLSITFNGEIYNYVELKKELEGFYPFRTNTDTEVILAAYLKWGTDCLKHFIGMFSFMLHDRSENLFFGARDRVGKKPFYYTNLGNNFVFSSEIKALLCTPELKPKMNRKMVFDYLNFGYYEHTNETFFDGIKALDPGSFIILKNGSISIKPYWNLAEEVERQGEFEGDYSQELNELLANAVKLRLRSDVKLGLHLTGGLDSGVLLTLLDEQIHKNEILEAYTGTYGSNEYDEDVFASEIASHLKVKLSAIPFDREHYKETIDAVQWHQEQPFGGIATLVYWGMEREARKQGTIVLMEGQGGDELFGGYGYYLNERYADLIEQNNREELTHFLTGLAKNNGTTWQAEMAKFESKSSSRGLYQDGTSFLKQQCMNVSFKEEFASRTLNFDSPFTSNLKNARYRDIRYTKIPRVLRFNDRMSMAHSLELRSPMLDHRLVEMSFRIPDKDLIQDGVGKQPLRKLMKGRLTDSIRQAPKRPVVTPQREWFQTLMAEYIQEALESGILYDLGLLDRNEVRIETKQFMQDQHVSNSFFIWQWVNLVVWLKKFNIHS